MWAKIAGAASVAAVLFGPSAALLALAVFASPAQAGCLPGGMVTVGDVPGSLTATTSDGVTVRLDRAQLANAATIITVGGQTAGVGRQGVTVALMAGLTESGLRMLSNTAAYPESARFPNNGDGGDHDSLGIFQMRPQSGWGSVAELMDPNYQASAFFGGPSGPNHGSPRGLLDIPGWQQMSDGQAAQTVEVSAFPGRYAAYQPVATAILTALARPAASGGSAPAGDRDPSVPESTRVVFPLPAGTWTETSPFGPRADPITGVEGVHPGVDLAAPAGTPILAATDGRVITAGMVDGTGTIRILATVDGQPVSTSYLHMYRDGIGVSVGELVSAGQQIGQVGSTGHSTGPHLHFEVHPGGPTAPPIDPIPWLHTHQASTRPAAAASGCTVAA